MPSDVGKDWASAIAEREGDLILELPIELLPLIETLRKLSPEAIELVCKNAVSLIDEAYGLNAPGPKLE